MMPNAQVAGVTEEDQGVAQSANTSSDSNSLSETQSPVGNTGSVGNVTVSQIFGFFNIMVGLMLVAAFLLFFGGFIAYLVRLGLEGRMDGLKYMYRGITILFVLIVLLGIVNYVQFHPTIVFVILALFIVAFGGYAAAKASFSSGEEETEH